MTFRYEIFGLVLETGRPLSTPLRTATGAPAPGRCVRFAERAGRFATPARWDFERLFDGDELPWLSLARDGEGFLLRVHDEADFAVDRNGASVLCAPEPETAPASVEQLLLDHILPQVLHLRGQPSFHASAVVLDRGAVAFAGRSGSGKSTLAASFPGAALVSDDCLVASIGADGVLLEPSYPSVRLWDDAARALLGEATALPLAAPRSRKRRVARPTPRGRPPLRRIYLLEQADGPPRLERLRRRDAIVQLATHLHRLDPTDRGRLAEELAFLEALVRRVPVARLGYGHRYDTLRRARALVEADQAAGD